MPLQLKVSIYPCFNVVALRATEPFPWYSLKGRGLHTLPFSVKLKAVAIALETRPPISQKLKLKAVAIVSSCRSSYLRAAMVEKLGKVSDL